MTNPSQLIKEREKEFDEKFTYISTKGERLLKSSRLIFLESRKNYEQDVNEIKDFHSQTIAMLLEAIEKKIGEKEVDEEKGKNDITSDFIAEDAYETKAEAFYFGLNCGLSIIKEFIKQ